MIFFNEIDTIILERKYVYPFAAIQSFGHLQETMIIDRIAPVNAQKIGMSRISISLTFVDVILTEAHHITQIRTIHNERFKFQKQLVSELSF